MAVAVQAAEKGNSLPAVDLHHLRRPLAARLRLPHFLPAAAWTAQLPRRHPRSCRASPPSPSSASSASPKLGLASSPSASGTGRPPLTLQGFFYLDDSSYTDLHFVNLLGRSVPPVDTSFSFLTKLPGIENIILLDCCNGLTLFWNRRYFNEDDTQTLGYIVCNPATKEWVDVPFSGCTWDEKVMIKDFEMEYTHTYLIFDPAVSSKFELVQFCGLSKLQVYTYSSESGVWTKRVTECWSHETLSLWRSAFVNGMQHLTVRRRYEYRTRIVAFNGKGEKCRTIHWPEEECGLIAFLGQSQGHLYCMSGHTDQHDQMFELSIWVLEDYDMEQWILKDSVSGLQLFGEVNYSFHHSPITIHPDCNLIFFASMFYDKLISYDMDTKKVTALVLSNHTLPILGSHRCLVSTENCYLWDDHLDVGQSLIFLVWSG